MKLKYVIGILIGLLMAKFLTPLLLFDMPMGYDPGIYRYLFMRYADALSVFSMPDLAPWAGEHPPGLFIIGAILMKIGIPVDALIGWVWNIVPVALAGVLAWVTTKRKGTTVGVAVLCMALISQAYFDGFYAMYYKAYVALILTCFTYYFAEKFSPWFLVTALLTVAVHHQTGLIMAIALGVWWMLKLPSELKNPLYKRYTIGILCIAIIGFLIYLPHFERVFWSPFKSIFLLRGDNAPAGAFPPASFYISTMALLLGVGVIGFVRSFKNERGSLWQISVLACLLFIVFRLVFYKRFFLHFDFFLLPFAAEGAVWIWNVVTSKYARGVLVVLGFAQCAMSWNAMMLREPQVPREYLQQVEVVGTVVPEGSTIIALENVSGTWLLGWLPHHIVGAPGLFEYPGWTYEEWEMFIDGKDSERKILLQGLQGDVYFFDGPLFEQFYGNRAQRVLNDPCLEQILGMPLLHSVCSS